MTKWQNEEEFAHKGHVLMLESISEISPKIHLAAHMWDQKYAFIKN